MFKYRHLYILIVIVCLTAIGTLGYSYIEGWSLHDSLYMTIITLTTTGFQEVHQLSFAGRNLTMILLVVGVGTVAYSVSVIMSDLLSINLESRRKNKMDKQISQLKDHTIICGHGRMGKVIADEIAKVHNNFIIIEQDPAKIKTISHSHYKYIEGDCTHDEVLLKAGIKDAKILVSMIASDSDALYLALAARSLKANLHIIVRASEEEAKLKILRAGANKVILPILMSGMKVAQAILNPAVEDYIDLSGVNETGNGQMYQLADINVLLNSNLVGKTLRTCEFQKLGLIIVGIKKASNEFVFSPSPDYKFESGDTLLSLGTQESYFSALNSYEIKPRT